MSDTALLVIDLQNDYFSDGAFPLWQADEVKNRLVSLLTTAVEQGIMPVLVQHVADPNQGIAPFFNAGTEGAAIHPDILAVAGDAPVVVKHHADGFEQTDLQELLQRNGIRKLLVAGMMTQNCVTHTAMSRVADDYEVTVLTDVSTTVSEMLHLIALNALRTKVHLATGQDAMA